MVRLSFKLALLLRPPEVARDVFPGLLNLANFPPRGSQRREKRLARIYD